MNRQKKWICLMVVAAAISMGGCGSEGPVQVTIGDTSVSQALEKNVTITSTLDHPFELYGNPPTKAKVRLFGLWTDNPNYPKKERVANLEGDFMEVAAKEDGFQFTTSGGTELYKESGYQGATNFKFYHLSTSDPQLRLWVVAGPNTYPFMIWVLGETKDGITPYLTPDDFAKAGVSVQKPSTEKLALRVENGALLVEKSHMDKVEPPKKASENGGKFEPAKVDWKSDKTAAVVWDNSKKGFVIGKEPGKSSGGFLDSLFSSKGKVADNQILSIGERTRLAWYGQEEESAGNTMTLTASTGKEMKFSAYPGFFRLTSADGNEVYYTSEPAGGTLFYVSEVKVSDPDTRVWSVLADSTGTSWWNPGFWLIGEHKGVLQIYITPSAMDRAGLSALSRKFPEGYRAHRLYFTPEDGVIQAKMSYEFWPPRVAHPGAKQILDRTFTIGWDKEKQSFVLQNIVVPETPAYAVRGEDGNLAWQEMTEAEQKQMKNQLQQMQFQAGRY